MIENTVQEFKSNTREQDLYNEVLRLQEIVDTLTTQREMLQKELFKNAVQDHTKKY